MNTPFDRKIKSLISPAWWKLLDIMDLLNITPKDFSWKLRWRIKYDRNPLFVELQDKFAVKAYANERGIRTAETFYITEHPETIPFDSLPDNYFIKANHGCGWNILCKEREFYTYRTRVKMAKLVDGNKYKKTRNDVLQHCHSWLKTRYSKREWVYQRISPKIMVEEVLIPKVGDELIDYKIYTFHGIAKVINVLTPTSRQKNENIELDPDWQLFKLPSDRYRHPEILPRKPDTLTEMINAAEMLGKELDFVRADFYDTQRGVTLGELTIYPEGGKLFSPSYDLKFNKWLGDQWHFPDRK